jgi:hypothetical protein|tara:strand:+ start:666 stop:908 length:243 start_codon:yes stop_codon:yes gene_type:complete
MKNKENPKTYFLASEVLEMIWGGLYESGQEDLARVLSDSMIAQGCQELETVTDGMLILMFWKNYLEENDLVSFSDDGTVH